MSHERIKGNRFLSKKVFQISENVTLSVIFTIVYRHQMIKKSFLRYFLIYLRPLSSIPTSKVEKSPAHTNRLVGYICRLSVKSKRCSKTHY